MAIQPTSRDLEELWDNLLSGEEALVKDAFFELSKEEKESVLAHLKRMAEEPGWHTGQRLSAQSALHFLEKN